MTYNKSEILKAAWVDFKERNAYYESKGSPRRDSFRICLSHAWNQAKKQVANERSRQQFEAQRLADEKRYREHLEWRAANFPNTELGRVNEQIFGLSMKDRWNDSDRKQYAKLTALKSRIEQSLSA